jgi:hypothetical protein
LTQFKNCDRARHPFGVDSGNDFSATQTINGKPPLRQPHVVTAFVGIFDNPYFGVSGADGAFTISNVPAGKQTVKAWHRASPSPPGRRRRS